VVLLLHGSADSEGCWRGVMGELAGRFRLAAPSLPGSRGSVGSQSRAIDLDLPWLSTLIEGLQPLAVIGHSYGALLALAAAEAGVWRGPVGLIEPIAFGLLAPGERAAIDALNARFFGALDAGDAAGALRGLVEYWNGPGSWDGLPASARDRLMQGLPHTRAEVASGRDDATTAEGLMDLGPAAVLAGALTTRESLAVGRALAAALGVPSQSIDGAGHQAPRTHAVQVARRLGRWLDALT